LAAVFFETTRWIVYYPFEQVIERLKRFTHVRIGNAAEVVAYAVRLIAPKSRLADEVDQRLQRS
jgi:hypothetical protein